MTICYIMNRCLVMFLRGEKVNVVQYWWNIFVKLKGEQVIILQMDQRLKTKNISDVPGQISCCQCKYLVKDTDNEFTECQTPRKKFQSIGISPVSLHAFTKTLKSFLYFSFVFPLVSLSLAYHWINQLRYFWQTYCGVFLENCFFLLNNIVNLTWWT